MIHLVLALALMQIPAAGSNGAGEKDLQPAPQVAPLTCGKYQHQVVSQSPMNCATPTTSTKSNLWVCDIPIIKCVDDMHEVTEREWQELMKRLADLEEAAHYLLRPKN